MQRASTASLLLAFAVQWLLVGAFTTAAMFRRGSFVADASWYMRATSWLVVLGAVVWALLISRELMRRASAQRTGSAPMNDQGHR